MTPAPISSINDSATSATISARRVSPPAPAESLRPPSLSVSFRSARPARSAGARAASLPVRTAEVGEDALARHAAQARLQPHVQAPLGGRLRRPDEALDAVAEQRHRVGVQ